MKIHWLRFVLAVVGVLFLARGLVSGLLFGLVFGEVYSQPSPAFRPRGEEQFGAMIAAYVSWAIAFTYVYARFLRTGGWRDGLRYGVAVLFLFFLPLTLGTYAMSPVPPGWVGAGLVIAVAEAVTAGLVVGVLYRPRTDPTA